MISYIISLPLVNGDSSLVDLENSILSSLHFVLKLHSRSLLVNIFQFILNVRQLWRHFRRNTVTSLPQSARKLQNNKILQN